MIKYSKPHSLTILGNLLISLSLTVLLSSCTTFHKIYPYKQVRELSSIESRLKLADQNSKNLSMQTIGTVNYKNFSSPVWLITYYPAKPSKFTVFIGGGIHGNEPAGVEAIVKLIEEISSGRKTYPATTIHFIPLINPWGWTTDVRYNREGIDISREFSNIDTQESLILKEYLTEKKYDLMVSNHEDGRDHGFYILTYNNKDLSISQKIANAIKSSGYPVRHWKGKDGYIHITANETRKKNHQTFTQYARQNYSRNTYIIESIFTMPLQDRLRQYSIAHDLLIKSLHRKDE